MQCGVTSPEKGDAMSSPATTNRNYTDNMRAWDDLRPDGAIRFYEGGDPDRFAAEMKAEFGFDVTVGGEEHCVSKNGHEWDYRWAWDEEHQFSFFIPAGLVGAVYGSERWNWELGS